MKETRRREWKYGGKGKGAGEEDGVVVRLGGEGERGRRTLMDATSSSDSDAMWHH